MRAFWLFALSFVWGISVAAADERPCAPGVAFAASGGSLGASSAVTWRAEPGNTASRVVMVIGADGQSIAEQAQPGRHKVRLKRGISTVVLVFYDAKGRVICTATTTARGAGSAGTAGSGFAVVGESLSSSGGTPGELAAAPTVVVMGRYVVVFLGDTAYAGSPDKVNEWVAGNTYDGRTANLTGYIGLEIYGNNHPNTIWGSNLDDIIHGGDESCAGQQCNANKQLGDTIYAEGGDDRVFGGNERCDGHLCNYPNGWLGDYIEGGAGNDEIDGGNEFCTGYGCTSNFGKTGDRIYGGSGDDIIRGGDEGCDSFVCAVTYGVLGDTIEGGEGNDRLYGGNETCTGIDCDNIAIVGDDISGGDGDDYIEGGDESCGDADCGTPNRMGDNIQGGNGTDTMSGQGGTDIVDGQPEPADPLIN